MMIVTAALRRMPVKYALAGLDAKSDSSTA